MENVHPWPFLHADINVLSAFVGKVDPHNLPLDISNVGAYIWIKSKLIGIPKVIPLPLLQYRSKVTNRN